LFFETAAIPEQDFLYAGQLKPFAAAGRVTETAHRLLAPSERAKKTYVQASGSTAAKGQGLQSMTRQGRDRLCLRRPGARWKPT